jgi:hypothetical protein
MARMGRGRRVVVVELGRRGCDGGVVDTRFLFLCFGRASGWIGLLERNSWLQYLNMDYAVIFAVHILFDSLRSSIMYNDISKGDFKHWNVLNVSLVRMI